MKAIQKELGDMEDGGNELRSASKKNYKKVRDVGRGKERKLSGTEENCE